MVGGRSYMLLRCLLFQSSNMDDGVSQHEGIYLYAFSMYKPGEKESHQGSL